MQDLSDGIFILLPGSCPSDGTSERWVIPGGCQKFICLEHWYVAYQIDEDDRNKDELNTSKSKYPMFKLMT